MGERFGGNAAGSAGGRAEGGVIAAVGPGGPGRAGTIL